MRTRPLSFALAVILAGLAIPATSEAQSNSLAAPPLDTARSVQTDSEQTAAGKTPTPAAQRKIASDYGKLPIGFEANTGQSDSHVKFLAHGRDYGLFLTGQEAVFAFHAAVVRHDSTVQKSSRDSIVRMQLRGSNAGASAEGVQPLPGTANYLIGKDPSQWHTNIPTWSKVRFSSVYPGIDLLYYGNQSQLEYDFVVEPEADANAIKLHFAGASRIKLTAAGDLSVSSRDGQIVFQKPVIYQEDHGQRHAVKGGFALRANGAVGFSLGSYDRSAPLIIDPVLQYSTYLPDAGISAIAVDDAGDAYVAGTTSSSDFPVTPGAFQKTGTPQTGVVCKLNASATALIYATYLGGSKSGDGDITTSPSSIAVDAAGSAYVAGSTNDTDFPVTTGAFQAQLKSREYGNAFVTKLNSSGSGLVYSTYLGGSDTDSATAIALDAAGDAYVAGSTISSDFPVTAGVFQTVNNAPEFLSNAFITKLDTTGSALVYSTYLGGSGGDSANGIALDQDGNAYVAGSTYSLDFPVTAGAFQTKNDGVANTVSNAFVTKLNTTGTALVYSTYLGGSGVRNIIGYDNHGDYATAIAVDPAGNGYVTGSAYSLDFPVRAWAFQTKNNGAANSVPNAFVSKLNSGGTALLYSTYLGGTFGPSDVGFNPVIPGDYGSAIVIDSAGDAYITGRATSADFPLTSGAYQRLLTGEVNVFIAEVNPKGSALEYSSYLGGDGHDYALAIARDKSGYIYLAGSTNSDNFPTTPRAYQAEYDKNGAGFITKLALEPSNTLATTTSLTSNTSIYRQPVILTATVSGGDSGIVPTGQVTFYFDAVGTATADLDDAGVATHTFPASLYPGLYSAYAIYDGDTQFAESMSPTFTVQVIPVQPVFSLAPGKYTGSATVQISDSMPGAVIHYTVDGTEATASSPVYTSALTFTAGYRVLRAVAIFSGVPSVNTYGSYTVVAQTPTH